MKTESIGTALETVQQVTALCSHPGWKLVVELYEKRFDALTEELLDPTKAASDAEILRQARGRLKSYFAPEVLANDLIRSSQSAAEIELQRKTESPPTP